MATNRFEGNLQVTENLTAKSITYPAGSIANSAIAAAAAIEATKVVQQFPVRYHQAQGSDVVSANVPVHVVFGVSAKLAAVRVMSPVAPAGGNKQFTVDVQKGNNNTGFTSVLSAPIVYDSTLSDREVAAGVVAVEDLAANDSLRVVVTASGSTGTQAQGLAVVLFLREQPQ